LKDHATFAQAPGPRRLEKGLEGEGPLGSNGWSLLVTCVALVVAVVAGVLLL
jgi:hypothetical protein